MIISRTPLRMSFIGGGTDLPSFYQQQQGAVISTAIDKYVYITVNKRFDSSIRVSYSKTEIVEHVDDLQHSRFREVLLSTRNTTGVEVTSIADVPSGTGLGSSSSFTVGLFNALNRSQHTANELAEQACALEMNVLAEPIGKQDQYAAAYGGFRFYRFNPDGSVFVDPIVIPEFRKNLFFEHIMLYYIGGAREASDILKIIDVDSLRTLRKLVDVFYDVLHRGHIRDLGFLLDEAWQCKKQMAANVTHSEIDTYYAIAKKAGALGGKVLGAGGGGFLMLFCEPEKQAAVDYAFRWSPKPPRKISFKPESEGSKIVYVDR